MRNDMRLNCINCGQRITLDEAVYADYDGTIKCNACSAILKIRVEDAKLRFMDFIKLSQPNVENPSLRR